MAINMQFLANFKISTSFIKKSKTKNCGPMYLYLCFGISYTMLDLNVTLM